MKTFHVSVLAVIALSLALSACDSGDKKGDGAAAKLPPKKDKSPAPTVDATANPHPPESGETPKDMNAPGAPGATLGLGASDLGVDPGIQLLEKAIISFKMKGSGMGAGMGTMSNPFANKGTQPAKPSGGANLTSLDQLVKSGAIKSIPEAPAGKKYVFDVKTQKVRLENK